MKRQLNFRISDALRRKLKLIADGEGCPMGEVLERLINEVEVKPVKRTITGYALNMCGNANSDVPVSQAERVAVVA